MRWVTEAYLDIDVNVNTELSDSEKWYKMGCNMILRDIKTLNEPPQSDIDNMSLPFQISGNLMLRYLNSHPRRLPLDMNLLISENDFELNILTNKITEELIYQAAENSRKKLMETVASAKGLLRSFSK